MPFLHPFFRLRGSLMKCLDASVSLCGWQCSFLPDDAVFVITSGLPTIRPESRSQDNAADTIQSAPGFCTPSAVGMCSTL